MVNASLSWLNNSEGHLINLKTMRDATSITLYLGNQKPNTACEAVPF